MGVLRVKLLKPLPLPLLMVALVLVGLGCVLAGVYMLTDVPVTLIVGGVAAVAFGLLADV